KIIHKRVGSTSATTRTHYYDQGETRHTGTGTPTKHYYTKDHLGTIHGITSGTGTVEASFRYDPYGLRTALFGSTSDLGYTGHWYFKPSTATHAAAKELYLTWYRMYDPVHGAWLSRDPI